MDDATPRPGDPFAAACGCALAVTRIILTNFRSYAGAELRVEAGPVVLAGANGTGKNQSSGSHLAGLPGTGAARGKALRDSAQSARGRAKLREDAFADGLWAVSAVIARTPGGAWDIGTGLLPVAMNAPARRTIHLNGAPADSADLAELLPMLWLTPTMDRLFLEGASERRRFPRPSRLCARSAPCQTGGTLRARHARKIAPAARWRA